MKSKVFICFFAIFVFGGRASSASACILALSKTPQWTDHEIGSFDMEYFNERIVTKIEINTRTSKKSEIHVFLTNADEPEIFLGHSSNLSALEAFIKCMYQVTAPPG